MNRSASRALRGSAWSTSDPVQAGLPQHIFGVRSVHADPVRDRLIAWPTRHEWRNGTWSVPETTGPIPPKSGAAVFDPVGGRMLVASTQGIDSSATFGGVWTYQGTQWRDPDDYYRSPPGCTFVATSGPDTVCVGPGWTWRWTGSTWTRTATASTPADVGPLSVATGTITMHAIGRNYALIDGDWVATPTQGLPYGLDQTVDDPASGTVVGRRILGVATVLWAQNNGTWRELDQPSDVLVSTGPQLFFDSVAQVARLFFERDSFQAFEWRTNAWTPTASPGAHPMFAYVDPGRGRWTLMGTDVRERTGTTYAAFEPTDLILGESSRTLTVDPIERTMSVMISESPSIRWVASDRRMLHAGLQLSVEVRPDVIGRPTALRIEFVGGGRGYDIDTGETVDGVEAWAWRWDLNGYVRLGRFDLAPGSQALTSVAISEDVERYLDRDHRLHVFFRSTAPLGQGPALPELALDSIRVDVDLVPRP